MPLPASANKYCLCWAAESTNKLNSSSYEHTSLVDHFPSSSFLSRRGRRCSLSVTASGAMLRSSTISPLHLLHCCSSCGFNVDSASSHNSSKRLEILKIVCDNLICHQGLDGSQGRRQEGPTGSGRGAGSTAANKRGTTCLPTTLNSPRFLRLHRIVRHSVGPQETGPHRSRSSSWRAKRAPKDVLETCSPRGGSGEQEMVNSESQQGGEEKSMSKCYDSLLVSYSS